MIEVDVGPLVVFALDERRRRVGGCVCCSSCALRREGYPLLLPSDVTVMGRGHGPAPIAGAALAGALECGDQGLLIGGQSRRRVVAEAFCVRLITHRDHVGVGSAGRGECCRLIRCVNSGRIIGPNACEHGGPRRDLIGRTHTADVPRHRRRLATSTRPGRSGLVMGGCASGLMDGSPPRIDAK